MGIFTFAREQGSENWKRSWKDEGSFKGAVKKAADRASTPGEMTAEPAPTVSLFNQYREEMIDTGGIRIFSGFSVSRGF